MTVKSAIGMSLGAGTTYDVHLELNKEPNEAVIDYFRADEPDETMWALFCAEERGSRWFLQLHPLYRGRPLDEALQYLIETVFEPNGIALNGEAEWQGDIPGNTGILVVKNNKIERLYGLTLYQDREGNITSDSVRHLQKLGFERCSGQRNTLR